MSTLLHKLKGAYGLLFSYGDSMKRMCWWERQDNFVPNPLYYHRRVEKLVKKGVEYVTMEHKGTTVNIPVRYFRYDKKGRMYVHQKTRDNYVDNAKRMAKEGLVEVF